MTRQRSLILAAVTQCLTHPTADEVFVEVRKELPTISLGTVYRNLEQLAAGGMITRLVMGSGPRRYDGHVMNHYHARCERCGEILDIAAERVPGLGECLDGLAGFTVTGVTLEVTGVCERCLAGGGKAGLPSSSIAGLTHNHGMKRRDE
ncbi:transcriptional repressor [bacterium]|nr:transcriptional repressor [candidate division CSSED10-310 bacterium]